MRSIIWWQGASTRLRAQRTWHKVAIQRERFIEAVMRLAQSSGKPLSTPLGLPWLDEEFSSYITIEQFHARIVWRLLRRRDT